ncbi:MAG: urease accessory protein UreD [Mycobacteriaceae bacterium]|nr:urease accessory protein UreD [Mycobacteriaceae bacterium]
MHSEVLLVATPHRWPRIQCCGAIQARCTAPDTVHLVSAAATPLGGDTINIRLIVEPGARLNVRSAAAALVLPGPHTTTSQACWELDVSGILDVDLQPTVVAATARHMSSAVVRLCDEGQLRFRERVQIGRSGERAGFWSGSLRADRQGRPVLRHRMELGAGSLADDEIAAPRAIITELHYPASVFADSFDEGATVMSLAAGGTLSTWQGERLAG